MQYSKKAVRSQPGMTQEEALVALQDHPMFSAGTKIASIRRRGKVWVADLLVPKTAGPFPPDDSGSDEEDAPAPKEESGPPSDDEGSEIEGGPEGLPSEDGESGPPKPKGESKPGEGGSKGGTEEAILHTLQEILHALQGGPVEPGLGGLDDIGPGPGGPEGPPPPHGGGPAGHEGPGFPGAPGAKLKPGEVPNKPGVTPIGSPAFASRQATMPPAPAAPMTPGVSPAGAGGGACPHCGGPLGPGGTCPTCDNAAGAGTYAATGRARTITASRTANVSVAQAKAELDAEFGPHGYAVKRIVREGSRYRALLSTHR
jgi:hypothetical protein